LWIAESYHKQTIRAPMPVNERASERFKSFDACLGWNGSLAGSKVYNELLGRRHRRSITAPGVPRGRNFVEVLAALTVFPYAQPNTTNIGSVRITNDRCRTLDAVDTHDRK